MKPIETLFWLGTAGVLYMAANSIVKNVVLLSYNMLSYNMLSYNLIALHFVFSINIHIDAHKALNNPKFILIEGYFFNINNSPRKRLS